jgi:hypothetical protein
MIKNVSLGTSSNPARYGPDGSARLINCYAEKAGAEGKIQWPIYASDGLTDFATLTGGGAVRAMMPTDTDLYVVAGRRLFRVTLAGSVSAMGGVPTDGPVFMARNSRETGFEIGVASDGFFGIISGNTFAQYQDSNLRGPNSFAVIDGYGVTGAANGYWQVSGQNNMRSWDALETANAESYPDEIERTFVHEREIMFFGSDSIEWWQNTGAADFSFARVTTRQIGCASGSSVARVGETVCWVDHDHQVRARTGYNGKVISTGAVVRAISSAADKKAIKGFSWSSGDHAFYAIRSPEWCWVYDLYTGAWHERQSYGSATWTISDVVKFGDRLIAGDATTGKLYVMSGTAYDEAGLPLEMIIQPPASHAYPQGLKIRKAFLDVIPGVGTVTSDTDDANPDLIVRHSFDGGLNWSAERHVPIGAAGKRLTRVRMKNFGRSGEDGFQFQFRVSANVIKGATGFAVDAEPLRA